MAGRAGASLYVHSLSPLFFFTFLIAGAETLNMQKTPTPSFPYLITTLYDDICIEKKVI